MSKTTIPRGGLGGGLPSSLTVGSASAEDTKVVFDGNAQDYHIGLEDSADDLVIGKGSALGTTTSVAIDENGIVRMPLQTCFLVHPASEQSNPSNNTTIVFGTERFDLNGDFASNTFTAPVDGKYQLNVVITTNNIDNAASLLEWTVITSNHTYRPLGNVPDKLFSADTGDHQHFAASLIADMDASDTAHVQFYQTGGTAQVDILTLSYFSGVLVAG